MLMAQYPTVYFISVKSDFGQWVQVLHPSDSGDFKSMLCSNFKSMLCVLIWACRGFVFLFFSWKVFLCLIILLHHVYIFEVCRNYVGSWRSQSCYTLSGMLFNRQYVCRALKQVWAALCLDCPFMIGTPGTDFSNRFEQDDNHYKDL